MWKNKLLVFGHLGGGGDARSSVEQVIQNDGMPTSCKENAGHHTLVQ